MYTDEKTFMKSTHYYTYILVRCETVCVNGGRCHIVDYGSRLRAQCACPVGFTGHHCEQRYVL